jgi:hypothetical protein
MRYIVSCVFLCSTVLAASLPSRDASGPPRVIILGGLMTQTVSDPDNYLYCHNAGDFQSFKTCLVGNDGEPICQSGQVLNVSIFSVSNNLPDMPAPRRALPAHVVNLNNRTRPDANSMSTCKGYIRYAIGVGSQTIADATALCSPDYSLADNIAAKVRCPGAQGTTQTQVGAAIMAGKCNPAALVCHAGAMIFGGVGPNAGIAPASIPAGLGVLPYEEYNGDDDEPADVNRLPQALQSWPGRGWYRLEMDGTWSDFALNVIHPDESMSLSDFLSGTEAVVWCAAGDGADTAPCWMRGQTVLMHRHGADGYMSDYLFAVATSQQTGRTTDKWNNPCAVLYVPDGEVIAVEKSEPNLPDVINSWLQSNSKSDLTGDGMVNLSDLAWSIENSASAPIFCEP